MCDKNVLYMCFFNNICYLIIYNRIIIFNDARFWKCTGKKKAQSKKVIALQHSFFSNSTFSTAAFDRIWCNTECTFVWKNVVSLKEKKNSV